MTGSDIESISLENISFCYELDRFLFEDFSIDLPMNQIVAIQGPSGSGKSAFLKILAGLLTPQKGKYCLNGLDVNEMSFEEFLPYRLNFGYSFDLGGLLNNRTLLENLELPLRYHKMISEEEIQKKSHSYLKVFHLQEAYMHRPSSVSGGMRKAATIARAFILEPQVLFLDDPTTGLGDLTRQALKKLILEKKKSGSLKHVFIASDDQKFLEGLSTTHMEISCQGVAMEDLRKVAQL